jgi:hypothetical protein
LASDREKFRKLHGTQATFTMYEAPPMSCHHLRNLYRLLHQSNRSVAAQLMTLANKAAPTAPDAWAAKVLACAQTSNMTTPEQILVAARVAALIGKPSKANTAEAQRRLTAEIGQLARDFRVEKAAILANAPRSAAPVFAGLTTQAAKAAYNNPPHWHQSANLIVPDATRMVEVAEPALAWGAVTSKFGVNLAEKMFDANVRGGALAVISVLSAAGNQKLLTHVDLTHLQYAAISDGNPPKLAQPVGQPTFHDAFHSATAYGVSAKEENAGDNFSDGLVNSLFSKDCDIHPDITKPLGEQPKIVEQIKLRIREKFEATTTAGITRNLIHDFANAMLGRWTGSAAEMAQLAERCLTETGTLAHLTPSSQQKVKELIYGTEKAGSFEAIAARYNQSNDLPRFQSELGRWRKLVDLTVQAESQGQMMSRPEFEHKAALAIAYALVLERAAPGCLREGPLDLGIDKADLPSALRTVDMRVSFPQTVREVKEALGIPP